MRGALEVFPATPEQEPVLANLLELYSHDFSEFIDLQLRPNGRFGYPRLSLYWSEEGRCPFLLKVDGQLAGFVLVSRGSRISGDPHIWDMAEFFIVRGYRKQGIGAAVARNIWRRFPGPWEVRVIDSNQPARTFWRAAIRAFTGSNVKEASIALQEKLWHVFSFVSPAAG
jgi:predicted acetyltransferase